MLKESKETCSGYLKIELEIVKTGTKAKMVGKKRRTDVFENYLAGRITDLMGSRGRGKGRKKKGYSWSPWLGRSFV